VHTTLDRAPEDNILSEMQAVPLENKRPQRRSRKPIVGKKLAKEKAVSKARPLPDLRRLRKEKLRELGLHIHSALPMFSHKLTAEEIKEYSEIDSWHAHRQAMQDGKMEQEQLPPHFLSIRGDFHFMKRKKRDAAQEGEARTLDQSKAKEETPTNAKTRQLKLTRLSAIPLFAHRLTADEIANHPNLDSWHEYREMIERGLMKQEDLPSLFQSRIPGKLIFRTSSATRKRPGPMLFANDEQKKKESLALKKSHRMAKIKALQLHRDSAIPIFAQRLKAEQIHHDDNIQEWHHHRRLMEEKVITEKDLPEQFKANQGSVRVNTRPPLSIQASNLSALTGQFSTAHQPGSHKGKCYSELFEGDRH
jgi:hypothetical protein